MMDTSTWLSATVTVSDDAITKTHNVLFDLWFPVNQLSIPANILPEIKEIAENVKAGLLKAILNGNGSLLTLLQGLTLPQALPFYDQMKQSTDPAIQRFVSTEG